MDISIHHTTRYSYETAGAYTIQHLRLTARDSAAQRVSHWRVIGNGRDDLPAHTDAFGNIVHTLTLGEPHCELVIEVVGAVRTEDQAGILKGVDEPMPPSVFLRTTALTTADDAIRDLAAPIAAAVAKDAVDAGVGARVGQHHKAVLKGDADAISHDEWGLSARSRRFWLWF